MNRETRKALIRAVAQSVIDHADELTRLDQAIGDGDHGINMKRGCQAVLAEIDMHAEKPLPEALKAIGMSLVMKVGGASGPLYGTLFMTLASELNDEPSLDDAAAAFGAAIGAVKRRGKSDVGQKTMLDVLAPVQAALANGSEASVDELKRVAQKAAEETVDMKAVKGRASFLGERSVGHMDPGARSSAVMVAALCDELGKAS